MSGKQGDDLICFNLGYGFGDTSNAMKICYLLMINIINLTIFLNK